jgi:hypothetical protein
MAWPQSSAAPPEQRTYSGQGEGPQNPEFRLPQVSGLLWHRDLTLRMTRSIDYAPALGSNKPTLAGAPLRNRTVDLLLTIDRQRLAVVVLCASGQA